MVPNDLIGYFTVTAQVAGTLIGLLFVSISLRYEAILGNSADYASRATAGASFIGLVNTLTISVWALVPTPGLGYPVASGLVCLLRTLHLHLGKLKQHKHLWGIFVLSVAVYSAQIVEGAWLIARPGDKEIVHILAFTLFGAVATSLRRAWALLQPGGGAGTKPLATAPLAQSLTGSDHRQEKTREFRTVREMVGRMRSSNPVGGDTHSGISMEA